MLIFWEALGLRKPTSNKVQESLAKFADLYSKTKEQITDYKEVKNIKIIKEYNR